MKGKYHVLELGSKGAEETIQKFCPNQRTDAVASGGSDHGGASGVG